MKEADIFENWINNLSEGTWTLPETPEQLDKLKTLMTKELIVGPDATNATEQLYDLVGDDELFDRLHALADQDPRANCWNDTEVMNRLAELGIELPEPTAPGNPAEPQTGATAPVAPGVPPNPAPQQPMAEAVEVATQAPAAAVQPGPIVLVHKAYRENIAKAKAALERFHHSEGIGKQLKLYPPSGKYGPDYYEFHLDKKPHNTVDMVERTLKSEGVKAGVVDGGQEVAEGDNLATFESILDTMRKAAGVPILKAALLSAGGAAYDKFTESRLMDSAGETLEHILNRFKHEVRNFEADGDLDDDLYHALYDYYSDNGEMPYGTMKARTGDPYNWISDRLADELGVNENLIAPMAMPVATEGAGCNMTMEGEYCPEHGLAECGSMYETMDEEKVDEIIDYDTLNQLASHPMAGTIAAAGGAALGATVGKGIEKLGNMFKDRKEQTALDRAAGLKEGDAVLARIKSLALIK